LFTCFILKL